MTHELTRRGALGLLTAGGVLAATGTASAEPDLAARIQLIIQRAEFRNSLWGMQFTVLGADRPIYALLPDRPFQPASAMKVFVAGTAFATLGPDYRFRTRVYRTGPVIRGVLRGDLVLEASGDLLNCGRMRPDGTLALPEPDHSYDRFPGAVAAPGDPLAVIRDLARQVAARGVRHIEGRVLVDASLFREVVEEMGGSGVRFTMSPMMINDNLVDVTVTPASTAGAPAVLHISPNTGYLTIRNETRTVPASATPQPLRFNNTVLTGDVPMGNGNLNRFIAYYITEPVRFAEVALTEALRDKGVRVEAGALAGRSGGRGQLAEHVSPPVSEQVKVMLKVSSNIHTFMWPHVIGSIAGHERDKPREAYNELRDRLFRRAGVDPNAPGVAEGKYTADFFVRFLAYEARRPYFRKFRLALPIMGKDGTLGGVEPGSPAAGRVYAKTGTAVGQFDPAGKPGLAKALAGYIHLPNGQWATFAQFMEAEGDSLPAGLELGNKAAQAMGEIATAVYTSFS